MQRRSWQNKDRSNSVSKSFLLRQKVSMTKTSLAKVALLKCTSGYAAFEYLNYGRISPKVDTYSFGVVVLELISGKKYRPSHAQSSNPQSLRDRANELYKKGKVSQFMDRKLIPSAIGVMCTQLDPKLRPTMRRVHSMLSKNYSRSSSTLVEEPMRDGSSLSSSSSTARISATATEEEDEGDIPIPMITKEDPIETMGKLCPKKTSARQSREKTPLPPLHMTKQTKEAAKKMAKQQQTIVPEIKVDKERLAANDAKEDFWQAITKLKSLETSFKKNLNDGGNKSSWCEEGFFEEGEEGKYKDQLTNPQDAIFTNNWEGILRKVGVAEDSLLFSKVPLSGLVEQMT
ncbi:L-type lectin-domain containing receptor kinase VIII.1 [Camellia lanceoleosa]|uniref:L-type lectin-domain containing receptor kinase VIII.1 n=1 Tax=Camellia lanceoleosa TaxID=1840588 RepID=A0ACC0HCQ6_9ERIC|nr:L-type lectin-domain containing receptor kinase VIII.1 [Camellia lanceoleosa]